MTDPTPLGTGPGDPTDPGEELDPRVAAAATALCGGPGPDRPCPQCVERARVAVAAADAVDPLRDDDKLTALVARGIADRYSPEPPDREDLLEAKIVLAAIRKAPDD